HINGQHEAEHAARDGVCTRPARDVLRGAHWGTGGVAAAWLVGHPAVVMPLFLVAALRLTGMRLSAYLRSLTPPASASLLMAGAVLGVRFVSPSSSPAGIRLALQVVTGVVTYAAILYWVHRPRLRAFWALARAIRT